MSQTQTLIELLKKNLRRSRVTYAHIAQHLEMSEANVKRLFATQAFTLQRIEAICELMQMDLSDLFEMYDQARLRITRLTPQQERELVSDSMLLLVAVSVRNHLGFEDITTRYRISETECIRCLARLDHLKIIDLLPGNRIKLLIDEHFDWLPDGPIVKFYRQQIQDQFLHSRFSQEVDCRLFEFGLLTDSSCQAMIKKLQALTREFTDLHKQDTALPLDKRYNMGLLVAMRRWELDVFTPLMK